MRFQHSQLRSFRMKRILQRIPVKKSMFAKLGAEKVPFSSSSHWHLQTEFCGRLQTALARAQVTCKEKFHCPGIN